MYAGRVWLQYTDQETLSLTPKQWAAQLSVHEDVVRRQNAAASGETVESKRNKGASVGYIDQVPGWG